MSLSSFEKDPTSVLDYTFDWSDWLDGAGIATSTWSVPTGLTNVDDISTSSLATIYLSGGSINETYTVRNTITTDESTPKTVTRSFTLKIVRK